MLLLLQSVSLSWLCFLSYTYNDELLSDVFCLYFGVERAT